MAKICEICKQPYDDKLTSCPNCDVDVFGTTVPNVPGVPKVEDSATIDLGGGPMAAPPQAGKQPGKEGDLPPTKVQGPIPPVGASMAPASGSKQGTPKPPAAPAAGSPMMARAAEQQTGQPGGQQPGKGVPTMVGAQGQPTMVAPQGGQPTMVAPQGAQPTMVAKQGAQPTMVAKQGSVPTMIAPEGAQLEQTAPLSGPPARPPQAPPPPGKKPAVPTMLPRGAAQPTMIAPEGAQLEETAPLSAPIAPKGPAPAAPPGGAQATMLPRGAAQPTMMAKGAAPPTMMMPPGEAPDAGAAPPAPADPKKTQLPKSAAQPTSLAQRGKPTTLAPEDTTPMELPEGAEKKKTMLPASAKAPTMLAKKAPQTTLAPEDETPMELPEQAGEMPRPKAAPPTMLAKVSSPTTLAPEGTEPLELPPGARQPKKTMMQKPPAPTVLAPEGTQPLDLPAGMKKTMLPGPSQPTTLAPPEDAGPMDLPTGMKKTMLPGPSQPTTLAPPEDAGAMEIPGRPDITEGIEMGAGSGMLSASAEAARMELEGGRRSTVDLSQLGSEPGLDSASKYDTAPAAVATLPQMKPRYKLRWFGGILLGLILASAVLVGLWFFRDQEPVLSWLREVGLAPLVAPEQAKLEDAIALLNAGHVDEAWEHLRQLPPAKLNTPEAQAVLGEVLWFRYLKKNEGKVANLKDAAIEEIVVALKNGQASKEQEWQSRSMLWLTHIDERAGEFGKARTGYEKAAKGQPQGYEQPFKAGEIRSDVFGTEKPKGATPAPDKTKEGGNQGAHLDRPLGDLEALELLAVFLTAQQAGDVPRAAKPPSELAKGNEAGYHFWDAVRLFQANKYPDAIKALEAARKLHATERFKRLKQAQNPLTDPTEEIFLRSADDMIMFWRMVEKLRGYDPKGDLLAALDKTIAAAKIPAGRETEEIAKALGVKNDRGEIIKGVMDLVEDGKIAAEVKETLKKGKYVDADEKDIKKFQEAAKVLNDDALTKLKIAKRVDDAGIKDEKDTDKAVGIAIDQRDALQKTYDASAKKLADANYIAEAKPTEKGKPPVPSHVDYMKGIDNAIEAATSPLVAALGRTLAGFGKFSSLVPGAPAPAAWIAAKLLDAEGQIKVLEARLTFSRTPRQLLQYWAPVLDNKEQKELKDVVALAAQDARNTLNDAGSSDVDKAAAHAVQGLVNRYEGQFDNARAELDQALKTGKAANEGNWRLYAGKARKELTDPAAYYLPRGEELQTIGKLSDSLQVLNAGVSAFPNEGRLLALRSQVKLDLARSQAKAPLSLRDPLVADARKDAEAAIAAKAAGEGNYALGRVFEDTGDPVAAEQLYRQALAAQPAAERTNSRYRVALGRVMLKLQPLPGQPPPVPVPGAPPVGRPPANKVGMDSTPHPQPLKGRGEEVEIQALLTLALTGVMAPLPPDDDETPDLDEIIREAERAIKAGNAEGYLIKAGALARKGQWTEALKTYSEGLRHLPKPPAWYAEGLAEIVNNHPAFNLPDPLRNPDPLRAERHYAAGLRLYFQGQYAAAEKEFIEAYRNQGQDARILYYLGLARLPQTGKRPSAVVNFQMAAILEQQNKPSPAAVNASLERVQGDLRRFLNTHRP